MFIPDGETWIMCTANSGEGCTDGDLCDNCDVSAVASLLREKNKRLQDALLELKAIRSCSPKTPWVGCAEQKETNHEHYDGHPEAIDRVIERSFEGGGE